MWADVKVAFEFIETDQCSSCPCQTPSAASESTSEPEAITAPVPSELPQPATSSFNSRYNTAPCLPPYTAYDLQVQSHLKPAVLLGVHRVRIWSKQLLIVGSWFISDILMEMYKKLIRQYYDMKLQLNVLVPVVSSYSFYYLLVFSEKNILIPSGLTAPPLLHLEFLTSWLPLPKTNR